MKINDIKNIKNIKDIKSLKKPVEVTMFNSDITPACEYCLSVKKSNPSSPLLCRYKGVVSPYSRCKKFEYDASKRTPKRNDKLKIHDPSEFLL